MRNDCYWPFVAGHEFPAQPTLGIATMEISEAKNRYNELDEEQQTDFLIQFAHALTIVGRECYEYDGTGVDHPRSLRYINEMQHRIVGAAMELREIEQGEKSRDWIIELMLKHENVLLKARSGWAFEQAISAVSAG